MKRVRIHIKSVYVEHIAIDSHMSTKALVINRFKLRQYALRHLEIDRYHPTDGRSGEIRELIFK